MGVNFSQGLVLLRNTVETVRLVYCDVIDSCLRKRLLVVGFISGCPLACTVSLTALYIFFFQQ